MRILLTNDDGIRAPVLSRLCECLKSEHELIVAAPATNQSGTSMFFTYNRPLRVKAYKGLNVEAWEVFGTPADCVKYAVCQLGKEKPFDLVLSGFNVGENAGVSSLYSGTVAAAREAALWKIPAIAASIWKMDTEQINHALNWLKRRIEKPEFILHEQSGFYWNINFPDRAPSEIKGALLTRMSTTMFVDRYISTSSDAWQLEGEKPTALFQPGTDDWALREGYISVTPMGLDQTLAPESGKQFVFPDLETSDEIEETK